MSVQQFGGTGEAKTPGNYAGSIAATETALKKGYQQVLWLDALHREYIDEVGAMNIAFVERGQAYCYTRTKWSNIARYN